MPIRPFRILHLYLCYTSKDVIQSHWLATDTPVSARWRHGSRFSFIHPRQDLDHRVKQRVKLKLAPRSAMGELVNTAMGRKHRGTCHDVLAGTRVTQSKPAITRILRSGALHFSPVTHCRSFKSSLTDRYGVPIWLSVRVPAEINDVSAIERNLERQIVRNVNRRSCRRS